MLEPRDRDQPAETDGRHRPVPMPEQRARPAPPSVMVIFGASGDLTRRKLVPALHNLRRSGLLPDQFAVLGVARQPFSDDDFRKRISEQIADSNEPGDPVCQQWVLQRSFYLGGDIEQPGIYEQIKMRLAELDAEFKTGGNYLYYLAVAPALFAPVVQRLGEAGLTEQADGHWRRVVIEKPFGTDLASAQALN